MLHGVCQLRLTLQTVSDWEREVPLLVTSNLRSMIKASNLIYYDGFIRKPFRQ
jgi:hypothetical protein